MKAYLLYADGDLDLQRPLPANEPDLARDLELDLLLRAMAGGDQYLYDVARAVLHASLATPEQIRYRQSVLADCLRQPGVVLAIYQLAADAARPEQDTWTDPFSSPGHRLRRSLQVMEKFAGVLRQLRAIADEHAGQFSSAGFTRLFAMLRTELDDAYLTEVESHLRRLRFGQGLLMSARLGHANKGTSYALLRERDSAAGLRGLLPGGSRRAGHVIVVPERDVSGRQTLSGIQDEGTGPVAEALAEACEHIRGFLDILRSETGFYLGCLRLHEQLTARGQPVCLPEPLPARAHALTARGLRDTALALTLDQPVTGNDVDADGRLLVLITGANRGGKSTFLRSVGLAQLMMQCGMFVTAGSFTASLCSGIFTHYKRSEDAAMIRGKLDEELTRMSAITDAITPCCLLLCNESFAATNEREGSHLASAVTRAMLDCGVRVLFVTHLHDLAARFHAEQRDDALFLRAERQPDGTRTYRMRPGAPQPTGHAADVYEQVFHSAAIR